MLRHIALHVSLVTLSFVCATVPAAGASQHDVEQLARKGMADLLQAQAQTEAFVERLAAGVRNEVRDDAWAESKEGDLRRSYAENVPWSEVTLAHMDCRRSKCDLLVELGTASSADMLAKRAFAVEQWIAWSQPCSYILTPRPTANAIRIFLECAR